MPETFPEHLKLEIKTSRTSSFVLSRRDIDGITPGGFAAVLLTDRRLQSPRWIFVPAQLLQPGTFEQQNLADLVHEDSVRPVSDAVNLFWSNWMLDSAVREMLFRQENMTLQEAVIWCLRNHVPGENNTTGGVREIKLATSLEQFRADLDVLLDPESSSQQEGFVHQCILAHALYLLGYEVTNNPVGVPDIVAHLASSDRRNVDHIRNKLKEWNPSSRHLLKIRDQLLDLDDDELQDTSGVLGH